MAVDYRRSGWALPDTVVKPVPKNPVPVYSEYDNLFADQPWGQTQGAKDILSGYVKNLPDRGWKPDEIKSQISGYANEFASQFKDTVGRDPTNDEYNQFFQSIVKLDQPWMQPLDPGQIGGQTTGFISSHYKTEAEKTASEKLQKEADAAVAPGSAFDMWKQATNKAVDDTSSALQDYQSKLFEKIRPQLLTSLQSQGLLNTGALNEAFAGQASDLANEAGLYTAQAKGAAATDIANKELAVRSTPSQYRTGAAFGSVPDLTQAGRGALNNMWNNYMSTNLANLNYQNQNALQNSYLGAQPSPLQQIGGQIAGGVAGGLIAHKW